MEPISTIAAVNEVKKILRFFDSLHRLEEVLSIAADEEKVRNQLKQEKAQLDTEIVQALSELEKLAQMIKNQVQKMNDLETKYELRNKELQDQDQKNRAEANKKVDDIRNAGIIQMERNRLDLAGIQTKIAELRKEKSELESTIHSLKNKATVEMQGMFDALKKISN